MTPFESSVLYKRRYIDISVCPVYGGDWGCEAGELTLFCYSRFMEYSLIDSIAVLSANYLYIFLLVVALGWFLFQTRTAQLEMAAWGLAALPLMYLLLIAAGFVYDDPRPFVAGHFTPLIPHSPDNGFPSDHTLLCSATATIVYFFNKKVSLALWTLTAGVGASRIYTGLHHPLDILTSAFMAFTVGYLVWRYAVPGLRQTETYQKINGIVARS